MLPSVSPTLLTRARMLIQDTGSFFTASIPVDGVSLIYDLPVESISSVTVPTVTLNGVVISSESTPSYTLDNKYGMISFVSPPGPAGAILQVTGVNYRFFDDDEVAQAVTDAFNLHVADQVPLPAMTPGMGQVGLPPTEEYLVSIMAAVELLWFRATDAAQEVDIHTPEGVAIPRSQRFRQITEQINALQEEYKTLAGALGVGIWRIQILNQRRVSLTTNRFVPLYLEQEYNSPYTGFYPTTGIPGTPITINGRFFTGATAVTFGGVPSTDFTVVSDLQLIATVPEGGMTGQIGVVTPYGVVLSTAQFVVGQPAPDILYGPEIVFPPIPPGL